MPTPTGISRRIEHCLLNLQANDYEAVLVNLFPAIDRTAKKRRPREGVGSRIKSFLTEEETLISAVTGNIISSISIDGVTLPDALYKFGRNPIMHEGELDERLQIVDEGVIQLGRRWILPLEYVIGMMVSVIVAPENKNEQLRAEGAIQILKHPFKINAIWGKKDLIKNHINLHYGRNVFL